VFHTSQVTINMSSRICRRACARKFFQVSRARAKSKVKPATVKIIGARFDLMGLKAWTLERQATADTNKSTAVAARPTINPQSLRPKGVGDDG
jgi:hypothetical protein